MIEPMRALAAVGQLADPEIDLADAALQLGRATAGADPGIEAAQHLSRLARDAAAIGAPLNDRPLEARAGALAGLIHGLHGYTGDREHYDDLANANLLSVIARRRGLPVSLGIIWLHCIRAGGWPGRGIDFPGHFLIQLDAAPARSGKRRPDQQVLIDPFDDGRVVGIGDLLALLRRLAGDAVELRPGMLRPMASRDVLLRLQRNIVERQRAGGSDEAALATVETMIAIAPDHAPLWREAAVLNVAVGRLRAAIECLERFVALVPDGVDAHEARARISAFRGRLA